MRYLTFLHEGSPRPGLLRGAEIHPLPVSVGTLRDYIALPARERAALGTEGSVPLAAATLLAPVRPLKNVFAVGRNYMGHAEEVARARGIELKLPAVPTFFTKAPTAISDPEATLHLSPGISSQYDYDAKLPVLA